MYDDILGKENGKRRLKARWTLELEQEMQSIFKKENEQDMQSIYGDIDQELDIEWTLELEQEMKKQEMKKLKVKEYLFEQHLKEDHEKLKNFISENFSFLNIVKYDEESIVDIAIYLLEKALEYDFEQGE